MAKTCVVNRDQNGDPTTVLVRVNEQIQSTLVEFAIGRNNGNDLSLAPNGEPSLLYQSFTQDIGLSDQEAKEEVAKTFTDDFRTRFVNSVVVDANGQPKLVWSGQQTPVTEFKAYTNREEGTDNIDNDGFFAEDKRISTSFATGLDAFTTPQSMIDKYGSKTASIIPVYLSIQNVQEVEDINRTTVTPLILESLEQGKDGFYGKFHEKYGASNSESNGWVILDGNQVIRIDSLSSEIPATIGEEQFIPSKLYEQIRQLPFITAEQALDVYKNIYRPSMTYWQSGSTVNINIETNEPLIYFMGDNGIVYSDLSETIRNSANGYSTGFMNNEGVFESFLETPVYKNTQIKGKIQELMKNDVLKPIEKEPNTYEAQDSLASEFVEEDLSLSFPFSYERTGNNFVITEPQEQKPLKQLIKDNGVDDAVAIESVNKFFDLATNKMKPKEVLYNESQLYQVIQNFMKKVGISETSIKNYTDKYKAKFGIEPDAKAFIDIQAKIIATIDGKATLDELSEEVSHFIVEAWNQDEIKRLLPYVKETSYYSQFSETYREIYSKQIQDPAVVEEYVQREILGKMLAESLQKEFSIENKSEIERNFFQKLGDILRQFLGYIQSKVTQKEINDIEVFNTQIKNLLYNEELDKYIDNFNPQSKVSIMYAVPEGVERLLNRFGKDFKNSQSDKLEEELAIDGAMSIFNDVLSRTSSLLKEVTKHENDDSGILSSSLTLLSESILKDREALELLKASSLKMATQTPEMSSKVNILRQVADLTLKNISDLSGKIQTISDKDPVIVAQELLDDIGIESPTVREGIERSIENVDNNGVRQAQKDMTQIAMLFGHVGKMSNAFVTLMSSIVKKLNNDSIQDTNSDFRNFIEKLIPYRDLMNKFYKGGNFVSIRDAEKIRELKLKYEYDIRKKIGDTSLTDVTEEDFLNDYDNMDKLEKGTPNYYRYDYLYKKGYSSQAWAEQDRIEYNDTFIKNVEAVASKQELELGTSRLYGYLKNISDRRSKYKESDPLRKNENQEIIQDRRNRSNIFNRDTTLKQGLSYVRYSEALAMVKDGRLSEENVVSTNPKVVPFDANLSPQNGEYVVILNKDNVQDDGQLAFDLLKWNQVNLTDKKDSALIKKNFEEAYNKKIESLKDLSYEDRNKALTDWISDNLQFDMSDEYWANIDPQNLNYNQLRQVVPEKVRMELGTLETELNSINLHKNSVLKLYKLIGDYKEIDSERISADDKLLLENMEIKSAKKRQEIQKIFDEYQVDMYKNEVSPIVELNQSFYEVFQKTMGVRYEDSTITQKKTFFSGENGMSAEKYGMFLSFEKALGRSQSLTSTSGKMITKYKNMVADPTNLDSVREAYLKSNAPMWYRRYDANTSYGNFTRDLSLGKLDVDQLLRDYVSGGSFIYRGELMEQMQINPAFKYTLAREETTPELYEEYKNATDNKVKFDLLMKMGRQDKLINIPQEDLSWITNDSKNLEAYIFTMDAHLNNLVNNDALTSYNVFLRPQQRKGSLERYETFITKGDKKQQIIDGLKERFQYREDDFIDSYKENRVPKYGLYRISPEELTDDLLGSLVWANKQSNVYKNKMLNYSRAVRAISALENQTFEKGKKSTETNTYKVMKEMLEYNFYGKTTTMKMETNILGQKIDMAKVLMGFRGFAIGQALGFSPIVALTNVTSGITQNQFMKWTGKNVFSDADDRALTTLAPLLSDSIKDVGDFNPTSKLNKLLYSFGVYNIEDRFKNAKFNKTARLLPEASFGMMAVGNFSLQARVAVSKLMEIRLVDGKFQTWRDYSLEQKRIDKTQTDSDIKSKFNQAQTKSMYDYLNDQGEFNGEKLREDGYKGDLKKDKSRAMSRIQDMGEQVTMEIQNHNEGQAARDPLWSFALSLKKWLILANTQMFSRKRIDPESGGYEEGLIFSYKYMADVIQKARKENIGLAQAYDSLEEYEKKNIRATGIITASMVTLLALAFMMKKLADDDDEKDNYGLQLANYMLLRNLNETFSSNVGVGNSLFEAISAPIMTANTLGNLTKIINVTDVGETVSVGKYKGMDKYLANWVKLTSAKNIYTVKDAQTVYDTRKGYEFFTAQNSLYHIFSMLPKKEDTGN